MKKSILILFMTFTTIGVYAQEHHKPMNHHKKDKGEMMEKMKEHLSLTDKQVVQIQAIHDKYESQEVALRDQMKKLKDEHKAIRKSKRKEVKRILTPEQQAKIEEMEAKRKYPRKGKGKHKKADRM